VTFALGFVLEEVFFNQATGAVNEMEKLKGNWSLGTNADPEKGA
jgi:hypothetical protein